MGERSRMRMREENSVNRKAERRISINTPCAFVGTISFNGF